MDDLRRKLFHILHKPTPDNARARYANYILAALIVTNGLLVAVETVPSIGPEFRHYFLAFEILSTSMFALEYLVRVWACVEQGRYAHPFWGRLRYVFTPLQILDLLGTVTFWFGVDLRFLRLARMIRLLKVLNLAHFEESLERVGRALHRRMELLIIAVVMMVLLMYTSAALLYVVEHRIQPKVFSSIPETLWWAMAALTTIGYGDMVPVSPLGKVLAGLISVFGIGVFALPSAIMTAAIVEASAPSSTPTVCRHCGNNPDEPPVSPSH